jgi:multidrug resistance efflux pump
MQSKTIALILFGIGGLISIQLFLPTADTTKQQEVIVEVSPKDDEAAKAQAKAKANQAAIEAAEIKATADKIREMNDRYESENIRIKRERLEAETEMYNDLNRSMENSESSK